MFSNIELVFETLDEKIKKQIEGKTTIHVSRGSKIFIENYDFMESNGNTDEYTNEHPIVRTNPDSGKKILFVNCTYTRQIIGITKLDSDELLKKLYRHQERLDLTCRCKWTPNAVAIWDNRSVLHYAIADYFPNRGLGYKRVIDSNCNKR